MRWSRVGRMERGSGCDEIYSKESVLKVSLDVPL